MAQKRFHIKNDGTVEECRKKFSPCALDGHWASAEAARIHLDNIAFIAERKAEIAEFEIARRDPWNPKHYYAIFNPDKWYGSARKFSEDMDNYLAVHGRIPLYLQGRMTFKLHYFTGTDLHLDITVKPQIEMDPTAPSRTTWNWAVALTQKNRFRDDIVLKSTALDFSFDADIVSSIKELESIFEYAVKRVAPRRTGWETEEPDYSSQVNKMSASFMGMFNAIESLVRPNLGLWQEGHGDFKNSFDNTVVVDVEYNQSAFNPQAFKDFVRGNYYYSNEIIDAEIRVTDGEEGDGRALWAVCRKNGQWSVTTLTYAGERHDNVTPTAEDIRAHVYWHVIKEMNIDNQEQAFKKSQYAADLFTMVENEIAYHNG